MENLETIAYPYIIIDFSESTDVECKVYSLPEIDALLRKIDSKPVANPDRDYKKIRYRLIIKEDIELADSFFLGYGECGILKRIGTLPMFKEYIDLISISLNGSYDKELGISPYMATFYENGERVPFQPRRTDTPRICGSLARRPFCRCRSFRGGLQGDS